MFASWASLELTITIFLLFVLTLCGNVTISAVSSVSVVLKWTGSKDALLEVGLVQVTWFKVMKGDPRKVGGFQKAQSFIFKKEPFFVCCRIWTCFLDTEQLSWGTWDGPGSEWNEDSREEKAMWVFGDLVGPTDQSQGWFFIFCGTVIELGASPMHELCHWAVAHLFNSF